jgi:hypothetical protein
MKSFIALLFLPFFTYAQTVHREDDRILYKGDVNMIGFSQAEMVTRLQHALQVAIDQSDARTELQTTNDGLAGAGEIKLKSPYHIKRSVLFKLRITHTPNGYQYQIDSVAFREEKRYSRTTVTPAKDLLEGIEDTGMAAAETEKLLNEIDLRLQKFLVVFEKAARIGKRV